MILPEEKRRLLTIPMVTQSIVGHLEQIGIQTLNDLKGRDLQDLVKRVNEKAGHPAFHGPIIEMALQNLLDRAREDA